MPRGFFGGEPTKESFETKLARKLAGEDSGWYRHSVDKDANYRESVALRRQERRALDALNYSREWSEYAPKLRAFGVGYVGLVAVRGRTDELDALDLADSLDQASLTDPMIDIAIGGISSARSSIVERYRAGVLRSNLEKAILVSREIRTLDEIGDASFTRSARIKSFPPMLRPRSIGVRDLVTNMAKNERRMPDFGGVTAHITVVGSGEAECLGADVSDRAEARLQMLMHIGNGAGDLRWELVS